MSEFIRKIGESLKSKVRLPKRGSPYLQHAILLASFVTAFNDPAQFYQRKCAEGRQCGTLVINSSQ